MVGRLVVAFEVDWLSPILENISHYDSCRFAWSIFDLSLLIFSFLSGKTLTRSWSVVGRAHIPAFTFHGPNSQDQGRLSR